MNYNDEYIIKMIEKGLSRKEVAKQLGLKSYQSFHRYMLKKGYTWNTVFNTYDKVNTTIKDIPTSIINWIDEKNTINHIAKKMHFENAKALHLYMTREGYNWNDEKENFEKKDKVISVSESALTSKGKVKHSENVDMESLLDYLMIKQDVLKKIIQDNENEPLHFSVCQLKGESMSKSIQVNVKLNDIMLNFCNNHGLSQKDFINTAIVNCLLRHGYRDKLKNILE